MKIKKGNLQSYIKLSEFATKNGMIVIDTGDGWEAVEPPPPSQKEQLTGERNTLMIRLAELDYIGVKIATGRATAEEYADQIEEMDAAAKRINEIDAEIDAMKEGEN